MESESLHRDVEQVKTEVSKVGIQQALIIQRINSLDERITDLIRQPKTVPVWMVWTFTLPGLLIALFLLTLSFQLIAGGVM